MTAQCRQCGRFKRGKSPDPVKDAMTELLTGYVERKERLFKQLERDIDEAIERDPDWPAHMWMVV